MSSSGSEHRVATRDVAAESRLCNLIYFAKKNRKGQQRRHVIAPVVILLRNRAWKCKRRTRYSPRGVLGLENRKEKKKSFRSQDPGFDLEEYSLNQAHPVPGAMWASRETILVHLAQSYRPIPSYFFFSFLQCPAELVRRNRLIRPRHLVLASLSLSFSRLDYIFAGTYSTSPENHTRFMSQALLYPTRSLLISLLDLPFKRSDLCPFLPPSTI